MTKYLVVAAGLVVLGAATQAQAPTDGPAVFTSEQASTGRRDVAMNAFGTCSDCHAAGLTGRTGDPGEQPSLESLPETLQQAIREIYNGKVPPLAGPRFLARWGGKSTKSFSTDLQRRFDGPLSETVQLNIMAYILQLNGASAGEHSLTRATDVEIQSLGSPHP